MGPGYDGGAGAAAARALVDRLAAAGVVHAVLSPGSRSTPLALQLHAHPGIDLDVVIDERSAAFLALGRAKASGVPSAVLCTSGTAAANLFPAVVEAATSCSPLVVLTADRPPEMRGIGANQTIDQDRIYGVYPRWFAALDEPDLQHWASTAERAVAIATGRPPGPVHLNVSFREPLVAAAPTPVEAITAPLCGEESSVTPAPRTPEPDELASLIASTDMGVVVAMGDPVDAGAVHGLSEAAGWPLLADHLSGARHGTNAITAYDALLRAGVFDQRPPDVVLRTGNLGTSKALAGWIQGCKEDVLVEPFGRNIDPASTLTRSIEAPSGWLAEVAAELPRRSGSGWLSAWLRAEAAARTAIDEILDRTSEPTEPGLARDVMRLVPDGTDVVVASSMPVRDLEWFAAQRPSVRVLANRGASGIDGFVSTAAGVARGGRPTVALAGDLSVVHDRNGLQAARAAGVSLTLVVINNGGGGIFTFLPQAGLDTFTKLFLTPPGVDLGAQAAADGWRHEVIGRAADLPDALASARGCTILEAVTDPAANKALHDRLWAAVAAAVGGSGGQPSGPDPLAASGSIE